MRKWGFATMSIAFLAFVAFLAACSDSGSGNNKALTAPKNVIAAAAANNNSVLISWDLVEHAESYNVYRLIDGEFVVVGTATQPKTTVSAETETEVPAVQTVSFRDQRISPEDLRFYQYKVAGVNDKGNVGPNSEIVLVGLNSICFALAMPSDVLATTTGGDEATAAGIAVRWTAVPNATAYEVRGHDRTFTVSESGEFIINAGEENAEAITPSIRRIVTENQVEIFTGLEAQKRYFFRVRALLDDCAPSAFSSEISSASTGCPTPAAPVLLSATALSTTEVRVTWEAVPGATEYFVYGSSGEIGRVSAPATSFTHRVSPGTTNRYQVSAVGACGFGGSLDGNDYRLYKRGNNS